MISKGDAVLYTLLGIGKCTKKTYCWPSQEKICKLVENYYKIPLSRRNLNRILDKLEGEGFIERIRRHRKSIFGGIVFCSTLYKFKGKLYNWLYSLGRRVQDLFSFYRVPKWAQHNSKTRESVLPFPLSGSKITPFIMVKVTQPQLFT